MITIETLNIDVNKKYVYKYNHNGKDLYYYVDDIEGDMFFSDIKNLDLIHYNIL